MSATYEIKLQAYEAGKLFVATITKEYPDYLHPALIRAVQRLSPTRHSKDFRSIRWFGKDYTFTPAQAVIVRELWRAWENGTPVVGAAALLEAADMVSDRIADLFRKNDSWGSVIRSDGNGHYWLEPPKEV